MDGNWEQLLSKTWNKSTGKGDDSNIIPIVESTLMPEMQNIDPRSADFPKDSVLWQQFLASSGDTDYKLFGALLCMRRAGTGLTINPNGGFRLFPYIDPSGKTAWTNQAEYDREKGEILDQVRTQLIELMGSLSYVLKNKNEGWKV